MPFVDKEDAPKKHMEQILKHHDGTLADDPLQACYSRLAVRQSVTLGEWTMGEAERGTDPGIISEAALKVGMGIVGSALDDVDVVSDDLRDSLHRILDISIDRRGGLRTSVKEK